MLLRIYSLSVIYLVCFVNIGIARKLPSYIHQCKYTLDNEELSTCLVKVFNEQRDIFMKGIPEMKIPSIDPMIIDKILFNTGNGTAVSLDAVFTNVVIEGCRDVVLQKFELDIENRKASINTFIPRLRISSNYNLKGKVLILQLNGEGKSDGNFTNIISTDNYKGKFITKNKKHYIDWYENDLNLNISTASLRFDDLFRGNADLTESTNKVINDNALDIINDLKPLLRETVSAVTFGIMSRVHKLYAIEELFSM